MFKKYVLAFNPHTENISIYNYKIPLQRACLRRFIKKNPSLPDQTSANFSHEHRSVNCLGLLMGKWTYRYSSAQS
jgi:hypothetical protein